MKHHDEKITAKVEQALETITVPQSLLDFVEQVPDMYEQQGKPAKTRARRAAWKVLGGCAAGFLIFSGSVLFSPSFAAYAKNIPGLAAPVEWLQNAAENIGIQNAKEHGYTPVHPVSITRDGYTFTIDNVFLQDNRLHYMLAVQGPKGTVENFIALPANFPNTPGGGSGEPAHTISDTEELAITHSQFDIPQKELDAFLAKQPKQLAFRIEQHDTQKAFTITVPFDQTKMKAGQKATVSQSLALSQNDPAIQHAAIQSFSIDPLKMRVSLDLTLEPGYQIDFTRWTSDWPYLTDETGKKYEFDPNSSQGTLYDASGTVHLDFMPSVYFSKEPKQLTLHLKKVWLTNKKPMETVTLSTVKFPQTIAVHGKTYTITKAQRKQGYWVFDVKKSKHSDSNRFDGIIFELPPNELQKMEQDATWKKEVGTDGIADNGIIIPVHAGEKEVPGMFTMNLYAPKQDTYTVNVRRYEDAIPLNLTLPLPQPARSEK